MGLFARNSKMARRLVRTFVALIAVPLIVTVLIMERIGRDQIVWTVDTMKRIDQKALMGADRTFQQLGTRAVHQSGERAESVSMDALRSMSQGMAQDQKTSLAATARDFSDLNRTTFDTAMRQSMETSTATLAGVRNNMTNLFARTAEDTRQQASTHIEKAMLALNSTLMQERADRVAKEISEHLTDASNTMAIAALMPSMSSGDQEGQKAALDALVRRYPEFLTMTVLDRKGRETAKSASDRVVTSADLQAQPNADYFQAAIHDKPFLALDDQKTANGAPTLRLALPIELYKGKAVGVLAARLSLEELWDWIRNTRVGKGGFVYILNQQGQAVLSPPTHSGALLTSSVALAGTDNTATLPWRVVVAIPRAEAMQPIDALNQDIAQSERQTQKEVRARLQGAATNAAAQLQRNMQQVKDATAQRVQTQSHLAFDSLSQQTLQHTRHELTRMQAALQAQTQQTLQSNDHLMTVAASTATAEWNDNVGPLTDKALQRSRNRLSFSALGILVFSCSGGILIALLLAGRIVRPVVRLAQAAHAIAAGELDKRVETDAPDEIGDLALAFNTMADSLQKSRSDLQEAEGQLVQSAKLASLGTLSAGVAHELNQPIAIIRGIVQQLQVEPGLSEDVLADLELVEGQTSRMTKIVKHLRTFCRAGGAEFVAVDLSRVAQDCSMLVGEQLRTHNIELVFDLSPTPSQVMADANEIEQVVLNLITNARDALEGRPDARITVQTEVQDPNFILRVRDNGPGIPDEVAARIFDPFFTTKEPGKGTGLGLSISHTIIQKHRGEIRVERDNGALFTITLPLAPQQSVLQDAA